MFSCNECLKQFTRRDNKIRHMKIAHGKTQNDHISKRQHSMGFLDGAIQTQQPENNVNIPNHKVSETPQINAEGSSMYDIKTGTTPYSSDCVCDNMVSCDDCGLVFESIHDLQHHVKNWCQGHLSKKMKIETNPQTNKDSYEDDDLRSNETFIYLKNLARNDNEKDYDHKVKEYIDRGNNEKEAIEKAEKKLIQKDKEIFMKHYKKVLKQVFGLADNALHRNIVDAVNDMLMRGVFRDLAIRKTLVKNEHKFNELFIEDTDDEDDSNEESTDEEKSDNYDESNANEEFTDEEQSNDYDESNSDEEQSNDYDESNSEKSS